MKSIRQRQSYGETDIRYATVDDYSYGGGTGATREDAEKAMKRGITPAMFNYEVRHGRHPLGKSLRSNRGNKGK